MHCLKVPVVSNICLSVRPGIWQPTHGGNYRGPSPSMNSEREREKLRHRKRNNWPRGSRERRQKREVNEIGLIKHHPNEI